MKGCSWMPEDKKTILEVIVSMINVKLTIVVLIICALVVGICLYSIFRKDKNKGKKPYKILGMFSIIAILDIPFLINELYKYGTTVDNPYITMWKAESVLNFYGTLLAFIGTVSLGLVAYRQNKKANQTNGKLALLTEQANSLTEQANQLNIELNQRNIKMAVRPCIIINRLSSKYTGNPFLVMAATLSHQQIEDDFIPIGENTTLNYNESEIDSFYFLVSPNILTFRHELTEEQEGKIKEKYKAITDDKGCKMIVEDILYCPFKLFSVGNGSAVNVTLRFYKENKFGDYNYDVMNYAVSLKNNIEYTLGFYIEKPSQCIGNYFLLIEYYDVLNNKYSQTQRLYIKKPHEEENSEVIVEFDLEIKQQEEI